MTEFEILNSTRSMLVHARAIESETLKFTGDEDDLIEDMYNNNTIYKDIVEEFVDIMQRIYSDN